MGDMALTRERVLDRGVVGIATRSGGVFYPFRDPPNVDVFSIPEVGWRMSRIPRFGAATMVDYNLAQHSVLVSEFIEEMTGDLSEAYEGLGHDFHEMAAGIGDVVSPVKAQFPAIKAHGERVQSAFAAHWGFLGIRCVRRCTGRMM